MSDFEYSDPRYFRDDDGTEFAYVSCWKDGHLAGLLKAERSGKSKSATYEFISNMESADSELIQGTIDNCKAKLEGIFTSQ